MTAEDHGKLCASKTGTLIESFDGCCETVQCDRCGRLVSVWLAARWPLLAVSRREAGAQAA